MTGTPCPAGRFPTPSGVASPRTAPNFYGTNYGGATVAVVDTATGPGGTSGVNLWDTRTGSACLEPG